MYAGCMFLRVNVSNQSLSAQRFRRPHINNVLVRSDMVLGLPLIWYLRIVETRFSVSYIIVEKL